MCNRYSIIIPVYNEIILLPKLLKSLHDFHVKKNEIIIVDDGSDDGSSLVLKECSFINLITLKSNRGKGVAIRTGLSIAKYNSVLIFDSDLEIPTSEIKKLMILDRNKNINSVLGYRYRHLKPLSSGIDWGNFIFTTFFNISFGTNHKDVLCCAKSFYLDKIDYKKLKSDGFSIDVEIISILSILNKNIKQIRMDYVRRGKTEGKKLSISNGWGILFRIVNMIKYF